MISASCSGNDIYLSLNPIPSQNQINSPDIIPSPNRNPNIKTFQSAEDIKFYTSKEKIDRNQSDGFQEYPAQAVAVFPSEVNESFCDLEQKKKVGFFESENISDKSVGKVEGDIKQDIRSDSINVPKRPSKKLSKLADGNRVIKAESEKNDNEIQSGKGNLLLRRSKSDAVMSRQGQNGETVSVKIQFTKDGIKVISDKESIV